MKQLKKIGLLTGIPAILFGILTLKAGGAVLFGGEAARAAAGDVVPFVLWFNFLAGFAYIVSGIGLLFLSRNSILLAGVIAVLSLLVWVALLVYIAGGGVYENRTLYAMSFRTLFWTVLALVSCRLTGCLASRTTNRKEG